MISRGFTLLEVLVAVSISAMIGVAAVQLLSTVGDTSRATEARSADIAALQRFNQVVSRDISQLINRAVRDNYGDSQAGLLLDSGDYPLEFTRAGWRNSPVSEDPRSTLQRVAYRTEALDSEVCEPALARIAVARGEDPDEYQPDGECLVRYYWNVLDRASDTEPQTQVVIDEISDLSFELVTRLQSDDGTAFTLGTQTTWPPLNTDDNPGVPVAIRWRFTLPDVGDIERVWSVAYDGGS